MTFYEPDSRSPRSRASQDARPRPLGLDLSPWQRRPPRRFLRLVPLVLAISLAVGCASTPADPPTPAAWAPEDGLVPVDTNGRGLLAIKPDHQLGRYDELLIEQVGFRYRDGQEWLPNREEDRIKSMLSSAIQGRQDGAIGIASSIGPCVLAVRFCLKDLELFDLHARMGSRTSFIRSFGEATLVMELRDSMNDEPIARFLQRRELGGGATSGGHSASLRRLGSVIAVAMRDMGNQLREIAPPTAGGWDAECDGGMTRVALGSH